MVRPELVPVEEDLLPADISDDQTLRGKRTWLRPLLLAAGIAAALVGLYAKTTTPVTLNEVQGKLFGSSAPYQASITCYGFSGGTCKVGNCDANRGATCNPSSKCTCEASCAGADGRCHLGEANKMVATDFTLVNKKWSKYGMYFQGMSVSGQLKTTNAPSWMNMEKDKFTLYQLPGVRANVNKTEGGDGPKYMLGSVAYPSEVAYIDWTALTSVNGHGLYSAEMVEDGKSPEELAVSVCYDKKTKSIMIGNAAATYWAYIRHGSWLVYASSSARNKVGDGGLWTPSPELSDEAISMLEKC